MRKELGIIGGLGLGAGLVYLLDPHSGKRRRAVARDKAKHVWRASEKAVEKTSRDLGNRARGFMASVKPAIKEVSDDVLVDRVRSAIGHVVSIPGAIQVTAEMGKVTLAGSVLKQELPALLSKVASVRGVKDLRNRLSLQPGTAAPRRWLKALLWTAGSALTLWGGRHPAARGQMRRILGT